MSRFLAVLVALALAGCATCQRHPLACGVGAALIAGSIAAAAHSDRGPEPGRAIGPGPSCVPQPNGSCR